MRSLLASISRGFFVRPNRATRSRGHAPARPAMHGTDALFFQPLEERVLFSAGDLDTTFGGGDGKAPLAPGFDAGLSAAPLPGGGWVAAGSVRHPDGSLDMGVRRYKADGSLDTSFGRAGADGDGLTTVDFGDQALTDGVAVAPDGKIVVVGHKFSTTAFARGLLLAQFNPDGTPDASFGTGGKVDADYNGERIEVGGVVVQPDRRIVVAGAKDSTPFIARFTVNGARDATFGGDADSGTGYVQFNQPDAGARFHDVALAPGGKIVAVGEVGVGPHGGDGDQLLVVRVTPAGAHDLSFGEKHYDVGLFAVGTAVLPLPDGRVVVGAFDRNDLNIDGFGDIAQLHLLSADGRSETQLASPRMREVDDLALLPDGRFLAAGARGANSTPGNFALAAYRPDGSRDPVFGDAAIADFGNDDAPRAIAVRPDGHVEVAGRSTRIDSSPASRFALARYVGTFTAPPAGSVVYQAESARLSGATVAKGNAGYTGSGYADFQHASGDFVEWTVNTPAAGAYRLTFRYANGSGSDRSLELKLNGSLAKSHLSLPPTGGWTKWNSVSVDFPLGLGPNTVRLTSNGFNGPNVDSLAVAPVPGTVQDRTFQAEDARVTGASVSRSNAGYTGTGYLDFNHATGDAIDWTVNLAETAQYSFSIRYANGGTTSRPLKLIISGVAPYTLQMDPTGSWSKWGLTGASTTLTAGTYHIRLEAMGFAGPNVDALIVHQV